eukprot:scaffold57666_cov48-Phaeocystis_antarctica.AAC.1
MGLYVGSGSASLRACKSLCERSSGMSFICAVQRACRLLVWVRRAKAGLVWRPSCIAPAWLGPAWRGAGGSSWWRYSSSHRRRRAGLLASRSCAPGRVRSDESKPAQARSRRAV